MTITINDDGKEGKATNFEQSQDIFPRLNRRIGNKEEGKILDAAEKMQIKLEDMLTFQGNGVSQEHRTQSREKAKNEIGQNQFSNDTLRESNLATHKLDQIYHKSQKDQDIFEAQADNITFDEVGEGELGVSRDHNQ